MRKGMNVERVRADDLFRNFGQQDQTSDDFVGKTAALEETGALRLLVPGFGGLPVFALQDLPGLFNFIESRGSLIGDFFRDATSLQVLTDLGGAVFAGK